jgi:hypothetical protein
MVKLVEKNVAELLMIAMLTIVLLSSCAGEYYLCDAYVNVEVENNLN